MNYFSYATYMNINRFQNLLETSVDEIKRQTIQRLLIEEKAKAALQASEPTKNRAEAQCCAHFSHGRPPAHPPDVSSWHDSTASSA